MRMYFYDHQVCVGCFIRLRRMFFICLCLFLPAGSSARTVVVGVYENPPKVFTDQSGRPAGVFIDIIEEIADLEGWDLEYRTGSWVDGLERLELGEIDLMPDVAYSTSRTETFEFHSEPVLSDWFHVYAGQNSGIRSIVDLEGRRVAVLDRSVQQEAFLELIDEFGLQVTLISLPDYASIFELVASGNADAAITNRFYGITHSRHYNLEDTAIIFHPTRLFFAAGKNGDCSLLAAIDAHLIQFKEDQNSVYYTSLRRWTADETLYHVAGWIKTAAWIAGLFLILSLSGSYLLKRQVNSRTAELQAVNREMECRIQKRTAELAQAMELAQAADELKSAFLATMSHELRTPLNSIIGFTGILLQGLAGPLNEEQKKQMGMVQNSARHLLALINDVLDISKIEAGQLDLFFEPFHLPTSIGNTIELVRPIAERKGLEVMVEIDGDVAEAVSDRRRFEQVLLNLAGNAVKFTEKGYIKVSCALNGAFCVLSVEDSGIGIEKEDIPGLFKPFHQIDTGLSRKHEGTGLGLSICSRLMEMMGGSIRAQSEPGKGSIFTILFPLEPSA